ncbi:MexH family multidrug efflux RND transporter periplasmic adaptor subunit [Gammaproteobacteria bacterium]|nr:MexH family multidrug efflux RND transporter periplasmic adaptor subunit [Gammaproteobacteria bacterium]
MKYRVYLPLLILFIVILWMGSGLLKSAQEKYVTSKLSPNKLSTKPLQKVLIDISKNVTTQKTLTLQGELMPIRRVQIKAETSSKVMHIAVVRGQLVQEGELILSLDPQERILKVKQAQTEIDAAQLNFNANEKLVTQGAKSKTQLEAMRANLSRAQTNLEAAQLELARIDIRAPFAGIIENTLPALGQRLMLGEDIVALADIDPIIVRADVPQTQINNLGIKTQGVASLLTGDNFTGKIHNIAPSALNASRTFEIEFALELYAQAQKIPPLGMSASLVLNLIETEAFEISPAILAQNKQGALVIKAVDENNKVIYVPIIVVKTSAGNLWVTGIKDGTRVITRGAAFVAENELVEAMTQAAVTKITADQSSAQP